MAAPQGTVRVHQQDRTVTFRVEGRGSMTQSLPMRRCAERLIAAGANRVRVDLRDCPYVDSTFMGTLLAIKKTLDRQAGAFSLVMPSAACARIVQQMGLTDVLLAEAAELDPDAQWTDVALDGTDPASFRQNVTQAHEELASLPGPAGEQFKNVMRCLEQTAKPDKPAE
jgi:anti-sigma B factor antagonist